MQCDFFLTYPFSPYIILNIWTNMINPDLINKTEYRFFTLHIIFKDIQYTNLSLDNMK